MMHPRSGKIIMGLPSFSRQSAKTFFSDERLGFLK